MMPRRRPLSRKRRRPSSGVAMPVRYLTRAAAAVFVVSLAAAAQDSQAIRLIVRGDDFGYTHASNLAMVKAFEDGVMTSASVLVPGPWFAEASQRGGSEFHRVVRSVGEPVA